MSVLEQTYPYWTRAPYCAGPEERDAYGAAESPHTKRGENTIYVVEYDAQTGLCNRMLRGIVTSAHPGTRVQRCSSLDLYTWYYTWDVNSSSIGRHARTSAEAVGGQLLGSCQEVASCAVDYNIQAAVALHCLLHCPLAVRILPHVSLSNAHRFEYTLP